MGGFENGGPQVAYRPMAMTAQMQRGPSSQLRQNLKGSGPQGGLKAVGHRWLTVPWPRTRESDNELLAAPLTMSLVNLQAE